MGPLKQDGIPLYYQLKEIFIEQISNGEWKVGKTIPNEIFLTQKYGVSRGPVRQALDILVRDGLLVRKQGKGTQVLPPKKASNLNDFYSFTRLIQNRGMKPSIKLLAFDTILAEGSIGKALEIASDSPCFMIRRLRLADQQPLILEKVYIPVSVCSDLTSKEVIVRPLFEILTEKYGLVLERGNQFFEPTIADEYEAQALEISKGSPVLLIENITISDSDRKIVYSKAIMRGDRVRYYVERLPS